MKKLKQIRSVSSDVREFVNLVRPQSVLKSSRLLDHETFLRAFKGKETSDAELIEDYNLNHNEWAFEELYGRYKSRMLAYLYGILGNWEDAKDVLHDAWETVLQSFINNRYREEQDFAGWFKGICYHRASEWKKDQRRFLYGNGQLPDHADASYNGEDRLENSQREKLLHSAMNKLTDNERQIIILRIYENKSFDEIGVIRHTSADAMRSRYSKALKKLQKAFPKNIFTSVDSFCLQMPYIIKANRVKVATIRKLDKEWRKFQKNCVRKLRIKNR